MPVIIHIETATEACSVALSSDGEILKYEENRSGQLHAVSLGVFVEETMQFVRNNHLTPDAVAISSGPGSYTGLRIGVSEAKGLAYGLDVPLIAIPTHRIMARMMKDRVEPMTLLCPMIDARRMEVYAAFFDVSLNVIRATSADIVSKESYVDLLDRQKVLFFGNGAEKFREIITHPNASFASDVKPRASAMIVLAETAFAEKDFVDPAYFEPFYLKEFVATVPKNKIISI